MTAHERLWAPWRSEFITQAPERGCFFCRAKRSPKQARAHRVVARGAQAFALLNKYPYNNGHLLLAPLRHVGALEALRPEEWSEMHDLATRLMARIRGTMRPHGFNIGMNLGRVAGAGVPGHLHLHLVPRWSGDTNYMPVLTDAKVIPQSLDAVYELLAVAPKRRPVRRP